MIGIYKGRNAQRSASAWGGRGVVATGEFLRASRVNVRIRSGLSPHRQFIYCACMYVSTKPQATVSIMPGINPTGCPLCRIREWGKGMSAEQFCLVLFRVYALGF